ncbi:MAG TPA: hypothetical protein VM370_02325 [Candidatus Thermoplasmatota archaeon]|nr:hypothetical protein [Candidatus Thermoplasmatota archaeon]
MAARKKKLGYQALRPHAARILKLGEYPLHVNGAYMDDPQRIPMLERQRPDR